MRAGSIIDFYDDPQGVILKEKVAEADIPPFVKQASFLSMQDREALPDDVFALVMVDHGEKIKKYACVDRGNTALSVLYFLESHDRLPEEAQKTAAMNLMTACSWYDIEPPEQLEKIARNLSTAVQRLATEIAHHGGPAISRTAQASKSREGTLEKKASLEPYVDITGKFAPVRLVKKAAAKRYALGDRFPLDDFSQVKEAAAWFNDFGRSLHPSNRREFCIKLAARSDELGVPVHETVRKYAGPGFAPDGEVKVAVATRMQFWTEDSPERDLLKGLMNKYASADPDVFCEALRQFDESTGMHHYWDEGVADPWYTTYGMRKTAEWVWESGNDRVTEDVLKRGVGERLSFIKERFGCELAQELQRKPVEIFDSLPLDHKRIISRIVNE